MKARLVYIILSALFSTSCRKTPEIKPGPEIFDFTPKKGSFNNIVTILGKNFDSSVTATTVKFNGITGTVISVSDTLITASVPENATTGKISITVNDKTVVSLNDFIILKGKWVRKSDIPLNTGRGAGVAFSIAGKGYYATGYDGASGSNELFEYNPATDVWNRRAVCPEQLESAICMVINNKAYIGTGQSSSSGLISKMWEYDPATDVWTPKADLPGGPRNAAFGIASGNKGYAGFGSFTDWWEYNPATDGWTRKADLSGIRPVWAAGFVLNNMVYMISETQCWQYNIISDTWKRRNDFPGTLAFAPDGFVINGKGYLLGGNECWLYDETTDTWTQQAFYDYRVGGAAFSINNKGYYMTGNSGPPEYFRKDFWELLHSDDIIA